MQKKVLQSQWIATFCVLYAVHVAGPFDPTQQCFYHIEAPTFYTPIVSQSDYYTQVLADDGAKKLIAQQMSVPIIDLLRGLWYQSVMLPINYIKLSGCNFY